MMCRELKSDSIAETQDILAGREFIDGFNSVRDGKPEARCWPAELTNERCIELASFPELFIDHWIELTGIGTGRRHSYDIGDEGVVFRKWTEDEISGFPPDMESDIRRNNRTSPSLMFPCSPTTLLHFVDTAAPHIGCFWVADAFRMAVTAIKSAKKSAPPVPAEKPKDAPSWYDIEQERGCRRMILENWETITSTCGKSFNGGQALRQLKIIYGKEKELPDLKTIQNRLIDLRKEKLIP